MRAIVIAILLSLPATAFVAPAGGDVKRSAEAVKPREVQSCVVEYGLYVPDAPPVRFADPSSVTGERFEIEGLHFTKRTKTIPAELHRGFGFRYKLVGLPKNKVFSETVRVIYPRPVKGIPRWEHTQTDSSVDGTLTQHLLYDFVYDYEVVPGEWKFQILVDNQAACSITFTVK